MKNFSKFTRKKLCWNLAFNKVTGWKICKFARKTLCRSLKAQTISISKFWYTYIFHCNAYSKLPAFCTIYPVCSYSLLESPVIVWIPECRKLWRWSAKKTQIKRAKNLCSKSSRYMNFFPRFRSPGGSFIW